MDELKTIKDFKLWCYECHDYLDRDDKDISKFPECILTSDLRQEAIKWIKSHDKAEKDIMEKHKVKVEIVWRNVLKQFLNISEEELK